MKKPDNDKFFGCIAWNSEQGRYSLREIEDQAEAEAFIGLHRSEDRLICSDRGIYYKLRRAVTGQPEI